MLPTSHPHPAAEGAELPPRPEFQLLYKWRPPLGVGGRDTLRMATTVQCHAHRHRPLWYLDTGLASAWVHVFGSIQTNPSTIQPQIHTMKTETLGACSQVERCSFHRVIGLE